MVLGHLMPFHIGFSPVILIEADSLLLSGFLIAETDLITDDRYVERRWFHERVG